MELGFQTPFPEMGMHLTNDYYWVKIKHRNENIWSPSSQENTLAIKPQSVFLTSFSPYACF